MVCGAGFIKAEIENEVLAEAMKKFRNKDKPETIQFTLAYAIREFCYIPANMEELKDSDFLKRTLMLYGYDDDRASEILEESSNCYGYVKLENISVDGAILFNSIYGYDEYCYGDIVDEYDPEEKGYVYPEESFEYDGNDEIYINHEMERTLNVETENEITYEFSEDEVISCRSVKELFGTDPVIAEIPDGIKYIDVFAFLGCKKLEEVVIPESVVEIDDEAFAECQSLKEITIPDSVVKMGRAVFRECEKLKNVKLPDELERLEHSFFIMCSGLENITLPQSLKRIETSAFAGCISLKKIAFPKSLKQIDKMAFFSCSSLEEVIFPEGLERLDTGIFVSCKKLKTVFLPESLKSIGDNIFFDCDKDLVIYCLKNSLAESYAREYGIDMIATSLCNS